MRNYEVENDLSKYFSLKEHILALEAEVARLEKRIRTEQKAKSKWKSKYEAVKPEAKSRRLEKNQRAYDMIAKRESGELKITLVEIGKRCGVNYGTLKHMAYEYRQAIR